MSSDTLQLQLQVQFPYDQGVVPTYANATLVNATPDTQNVIVDFGFLDPFLIAMVQSQAPNEIEEGNVKSLTITAQPLQRFVISLPVAKQLAMQIQKTLESLTALSTIEEDRNA